MNLKEIFIQCQRNNFIEEDFIKLQREAKEYIYRTYFFLAISGNTIFFAGLFVYLIVNKIDIRFVWGYVVLGLAVCVWSAGIVRFTQKKKMLQQIISYPDFKQLSAKCTYVVQMNMEGIRYEFETKESPWQRFQLDALKTENYIMNVREGDEVCILQFFSKYYVVFSLHKRYETRVCNDIKSIFSMSNFNERQRRAYLLCYVVDVMLLTKIIYEIVINDSKDFSMAVVVYIVVFFIMLLAIILLRSKNEHE